MLIPHRTSDVQENALPPDDQRILTAVRQAAGPVTARQVGEMLSVGVNTRPKLEPLRGKLIRLVDRSRLRKLPDGRFTARLSPATADHALHPIREIVANGSGAARLSR